MIFTKIKSICEKRNISIRSLEREAELSAGSICKWNESSPTVENLSAVCRVLGITIDSLVEQKQ